MVKLELYKQEYLDVYAAYQEAEKSVPRASDSVANLKAESKAALVRFRIAQALDKGERPMWEAIYPEIASVYNGIHAKHMTKAQLIVWLRSTWPDALSDVNCGADKVSRETVSGYRSMMARITAEKALFDLNEMWYSYDELSTTCLIGSWDASSFEKLKLEIDKHSYGNLDRARKEFDRYVSAYAIFQACGRASVHAQSIAKYASVETDYIGSALRYGSVLKTADDLLTQVHDRVRELKLSTSAPRTEHNFYRWDRDDIILKQQQTVLVRARQNFSFIKLHSDKASALCDRVDVGANDVWMRERDDRSTVKNTFDDSHIDAVIDRIYGSAK